MNSSEQKRFDALYVQHQRALKLHGYSAATIDPLCQWLIGGGVV